MSARIVYKDIAPGAAEDAAVTATAQNWTDPALIPFGTGNADPIASLEWNNWLTDGSRVLKDQQTPAYWSTPMSGDDCAFASAPTIALTFSQNFSSLGLYFIFDPSTINYATDLQITWYQGATQLKQETYEPTAASYFCPGEVTAFNRIEIQLLESSLPYRYLKIQQIMIGLVREFDLDELRSVQVMQECDLISEEVAINTLDVELESRDDIGFMFQLKQPVSAYDGETLIGVFYIDGSSRKGPYTYTISCIDALGVLDDSPAVAAVYTNKNAKALIEEILGADFELDMDAALQAATVTGLLPAGTRREALQQVCFAIGAAVDTSGTDKVRVFVPATSDPATIADGRVYSGGTVETEAIVTAVRVTAHSYGTTAVPGASTVVVDGVTYYDTQTVTEIVNPDVTASDKANVVEVTGATLVSPANVATVAQRVYDYYARRTSQRIKIVLDDERPGDRVTASTPWAAVVEGNLTHMGLTLSAITAADCEVRGA